METSNGTLEVVDLDVNLDEPVPCSGRKPDGSTCDNEATWRMTHSPCGCQFNGCDPCKVQYETWFKWLRRVLTCVSCDRFVLQSSWRPL